MNVRSPAPPFAETAITIDDDRIEEALQYGHTSGHPDLVKFFTEMQTRFHGRKKNPSWRISVGAGSQDLLYKAFQTLTDPGDTVLVEVSKIGFEHPSILKMHTS
jgi:tryptophan aminotransferase